MKKDYIIVSVSLLVSLFIYLFYRTGKTVVNDFFISFITCDQFRSMQKSVSAAIPLSEQSIYSLPGGIWVFCVTLSSKPFFIKRGDLKLPLHFLPLIFAVGLEFFQLLQLTNGRFDLWDIVFSLLGWTVGSYVLGKQSRTEDVLCPVTVSRIVCILTYLSVFLAHVWQ